MRSRIYTIISGHFKSWYRSKSNIFWTIAFPLLLIVLFGAIFGSGSTKFDLYLQNQDLSANTPTPLSQGYVSVLNNTRAFNLYMVPAEQTNALAYVKDDAQSHNRGQRLLVIPSGFQTMLNTTRQAKIQLYMDQSDQASVSLVGIVNAATVSYAAHLSPSADNVIVQQVGIVTKNIRYIDFFSYAIFGVTATIDIYTVGLVVAASLLFPGIGMVLANFVKEAEGADAAANAITFPMMFLAGTFWPRDSLPDIMKNIANFMPLTYVNDGLRYALIYAQPAQALTNMLIALGLAAFFIVLGSVLMNWKEE